MRFDKPLIAFIIGAIATLPYYIFSVILIALGFGKYSLYELSSLIVTINRPTTALGIFTSSLVGGFSAIVLYYALGKIGTDYLMYKSITAGLFSWIITEAIFVWLIEGPKLIPPRPLSDYFLHLFGSVIFGIMVGLLYKRYLFKNLYNA